MRRTAALFKYDSFQRIRFYGQFSYFAIANLAYNLYWSTVSDNEEIFSGFICGQKLIGEPPPLPWRKRTAKHLFVLFISLEIGKKKPIINSNNNDQDAQYY